MKNISLVKTISEKNPFKKIGFSQKFIITITIIYSALVLLSGISYYFTTKYQTDILEKILIRNNNEILLQKASIAISGLKQSKADSIKKIKSELLRYCTEKNNFLYLFIFSRTSDENYFKVIDTLPINKKLNLLADKSDVVKEIKDTNYLKLGMRRNIVEPNIYSINKLYWQNVYCPYKIGKRTYVIQFIISTPERERILSDYSRSIRQAKRFIFIITTIIIIAVLSLSFIFINNYTFLIRKISSGITGATKGEYDFSLNKSGDDELDKLSDSFSLLIEELKNRPEEPSSSTQDNLFTMGVNLLKNSRIEDSIAIFKTLIILDEKSFGSHFNLGVALARLKDFNGSCMMFNRALELNPSHETTMKYLNRVEKLKTK